MFTCVVCVFVENTKAAGTSFSYNLMFYSVFMASHMSKRYCRVFFLVLFLFCFLRCSFTRTKSQS